jgi:hypothetical protein
MKMGIENSFRKIGKFLVLICFLGSGFFLLNGFTGSAIMEISQRNSGLFGAGLFFLGLAGLYFLSRSKNQGKKI